MTVGENIKRIRKEKGYTQKELAEKCEMYESQIRKYELGKANPKIETIDKIARAFNVPIFELLDFNATIGLANTILTDATTEHELDVVEKVSKIAEEKYKEKHPLDIRLMVAFDELNEHGKEKIVNYAEDIAKLPEYQKEALKNYIEFSSDKTPEYWNNLKEQLEKADQKPTNPPQEETDT